MRQVIQDLRSGEIEVLQLPDPAALPGHVLVQNRWSVISAGTEGAISRVAKKSLLGKARERPADARRVLEKVAADGLRSTRDAVNARLADSLTPGYSSMGVVAEVGAGVEGFAPGDRVGCVGANLACHAERVTVPAPLCLPLPGEVPDRAGAFGALGGIAAHGVRLAGVGAGDVVAVIGLGLVGQIVSQIASAAGARVLAIDTDPDRVDLAVELGAAAGSSAAVEDAAASARAHSGGHGVDAVLIAAATPSSGPIELAAELARDRAAVCAIGDVGLDVPRTPFYEKELRLLVSRSYGPGRYDPGYEEEGRDYPIGYVRWTERRLIGYFFDEIARGRIALDRLITHEFAIDDAARAYEALAEPGRLAVMLRYPEADQSPSRSEMRIEPAPARKGSAQGRGARAALIGPGNFARSVLLPKLDRLDVDLVAVAGRSPARAAAAAKRFGAAAVATDPAEVIANPDIDIVVIATQHDSHAPLATAALGADKSVFVEKPLAIDEGGLAAVEAALASGRLVVGFNRSVAQATESVREHFSGRSDPLHVHCRVNAGPLPRDHWLGDVERGGGRLVGEGCHFVDLASALIGEPADSVQIIPVGAPTGASESFTLTLRYRDGSTATISYLAAGSPKMAKERIEVIGAGRSASIDDFRSVELYGARRRRRGRLRHLPLSSQDKGHDELLASAVDFFAGRAEAPIPYDRALETTRATLLARDALTRGEQGPVAL